MIFRLSQKLSTKLDSGNLNEMLLNQNPYADWSCHLFTADRTQYILLSNTPSLYSCVLFGRGISKEKRFIQRAFATIREHMEDDGQAFVYQRFIAPESGRVSFAKSLNRSVVGSMNELIAEAKAILAEQETAPPDASVQLNDVLLSALGEGKNGSYGTPNEAFKRLANTAISGRQQP